MGDAQTILAGADPDGAVPGLRESGDGVIIQLRPGFEFLRSQDVEAVGFCPHPEAAFAVFGEGEDGLRAELLDACCAAGCALLQVKAVVGSDP